MRECVQAGRRVGVQGEDKGSTGRGERRDVRRGGGRSRKIASGRAQRGAHTVEHRRAKVARSEERRGCHRHRYLVAPRPILLFGTRTVDPGLMPVTSDSRRRHSVDVTECRQRANPICQLELGSQQRRRFLPCRLTRMTHADVPDGSPDPGRARPTQSFAAPTAHCRAHLSYPLL